jgi:hypothetical protein
MPLLPEFLQNFFSTILEQDFQEELYNEWDHWGPFFNPAVNNGVQVKNFAIVLHLMQYLRSMGTTYEAVSVGLFKNMSVCPAHQDIVIYAKHAQDIRDGIRTFQVKNGQGKRVFFYPLQTSLLNNVSARLNDNSNKENNPRPPVILQRSNLGHVPGSGSLQDVLGELHRGGDIRVTDELVNSFSSIDIMRVGVRKLDQDRKRRIEHHRQSAKNNLQNVFMLKFRSLDAISSEKLLTQARTFAEKCQNEDIPEMWGSMEKNTKEHEFFSTLLSLKIEEQKRGLRQLEDLANTVSSNKALLSEEVADFNLLNVEVNTLRNALDLNGVDIEANSDKWTMVLENLDTFSGIEETLSTILPRYAMKKIFPPTEGDELSDVASRIRDLDVQGDDNLSILSQLSDATPMKTDINTSK